MSNLKITKIPFSCNDLKNNSQEFNLYDQIKKMYPTLKYKLRPILNQNRNYPTVDRTWKKIKVALKIIEELHTFKGDNIAYFYHAETNLASFLNTQNYILWKDSATETPSITELIQKINQYRRENMTVPTLIQGEYVLDETLSFNLTEQLKTEVKIHYNNTEDTYILCTTNTMENIPLCHYILNALYYKNRSEELMQFYTALATNNIDKVNKHLELYEAMFDEQAYNFINLENFGQIAERIKNIQLKLKKVDEDLQYFFKAFTNSLKHKEELIIEQESLNKIDTSTQSQQLLDFKDYLKNHLYLKIYDWHEPNAHLKINIPITYYDEDLAEIVINRRFEEDPIIKEIFTDIFIKRKYKFLTWTIIEFNVKSFYIIPFNDENLLEPDGNYFPHPHINFYDCVGSFLETVQEWQQNFDYIGACEQIVSLATNLNFADSVVIDNLFYKLFETSLGDVECFEDEYGTNYSFNELYENYKQDMEEK